MWGTAEFQNLIDANTETKGLQLPDNFESKFGDKASRQKIVDAAMDKFTTIEPADKKAITDKAATEIKSWKEKPKAGDPDYSSKIAVLYLYTLLDDPTKSHTTNPEEVLKNYDTLKTAFVSTTPKETSTISTMELKKTTVVSPAEAPVKKIEMRVKTPEELQNEKIMNLQSLQTSEAFKKLPATLQKKVNTILNLTEKDNQTDKKMEEITKNINSIDAKITALQEQNKIKQARIDEITQTIDVLRDKHLPRKDLRQERRSLKDEISDNNDLLYWTGWNDGLIKDVHDQKISLAQATDQKNGITEKFEDKLADVDKLLASEIASRASAFESITDENTKKVLNEQVVNLKTIQDQLVTLQTKEPEWSKVTPLVAGKVADTIQTPKVWEDEILPNNLVAKEKTKPLDNTAVATADLSKAEAVVNTTNTKPTDATKIAEADVSVDSQIKTDIITTDPVTIDNIWNIINGTQLPLIWPDAKKYQKEFDNLNLELSLISNVFKNYQEQYSSRPAFENFKTEINKSIKEITDKIWKIRNDATKDDPQHTVRYIWWFSQEQEQQMVEMNINTIASWTWLVTIEDELDNI